MIQKSCKVMNIDNTYLLHPRSEDLITNMYQHNAIHSSEYFDVERIFDFRNEIINNFKNSDIHFYIVLFNEKMEEINLTIDNTINSTIYYFDRIKTKTISFCFENKNKLDYIYEKKDFIPEISNLNKNKLLYLGSSSNFKNKLAWENTVCFSSEYSNTGKGFFSFELNLKNMIQEPKYGYILGFKNKKIADKNFQNNEVLPSAPPIDLIPSAPPFNFS